MGNCSECGGCGDATADTKDADVSFQCDPAGAVFDDAVKDLGELSRLCFSFAGSSNLAALRWLFVLGASPTLIDANGSSLLHVACRKGSQQIIQELLARRIGPDIVDNAKWTPLHVASCMGRGEVAAILIMAGATVDILNKKGETAQDLCASSCMKEMLSESALSLQDKAMLASQSSVLPPTSINPTSSRAPLDFEPHFVPRMPVQAGLDEDEDMKWLAMWVFNLNPGQGLAFIVATGISPDCPIELISFLVRNGADPGNFSQFLGDESPISKRLRITYLKSVPLFGTGVLSALATSFLRIAVPGDLRKLDRLTRAIARSWWRQHDGEVEHSVRAPRSLEATLTHPTEIGGHVLHQAFQSVEGLQRVLFSTVMLHKYLNEETRSMNLEEWLDVNAGIDRNGQNVPVNILENIYQSVSRGLSFLSHIPLLQVPKVRMHETWATLIYYSIEEIGGKGSAGIDSNTSELKSPREIAQAGGQLTSGRASPMPQDDSLELSMKGTSSTEIVWISLHPTMLFIGRGPDTAPYAFIIMKNVRLKRVHFMCRQVVLANDRNHLEFCLLLSDGRFQLLELPELNVRFGHDTDFDTWTAFLTKYTEDLDP